MRRAKRRWLLRCFTAEWQRVVAKEKEKRTFGVYAADVVAAGRCRRRLAAWRGATQRKVERCRLTVSKPVLKAPMVSAISA